MPVSMAWSMRGWNSRRSWGVAPLISGGGGASVKGMISTWRAAGLCLRSHRSLWRLSRSCSVKPRRRSSQQSVRFQTTMRSISSGSFRSSSQEGSRSLALWVTEPRG